MREHLVAQDGVGNLRRVHEVHLEQPGLERALLGLVVLERVEEEARRLREEVLSHEDVCDSLEVDHRAVLVVDQLGGKLGGLLGADADQVLKQLDVVGSVARLL